MFLFKLIQNIINGFAALLFKCQNNSQLSIFVILFLFEKSFVFS